MRSHSTQWNYLHQPHIQGQYICVLNKIGAIVKLKLEGPKPYDFSLYGNSNEAVVRFHVYAVLTRRHAYQKFNFVEAMMEVMNCIAIPLVVAYIGAQDQLRINYGVRFEHVAYTSRLLNDYTSETYFIFH
jgi:hypothetical protein